MTYREPGRGVKRGLHLKSGASDQSASSHHDQGGASVFYLKRRENPGIGLDVDTTPRPGVGNLSWGLYKYKSTEEKKRTGYNRKCVNGQGGKMPIPGN